MGVTETGQQVFPDVERVLYAKAPLIEVIAQTRFPADLRLETEPPANFQQKIRASFPILRQQTRSVVSGLPPEVAKAFEAVAPPTGTNTIWQFSTEDNDHTLELTKDNLTLIARKYEKWEAFWALYEVALRSFFEIYTPPFLVRIGLRYRDVIQRSKLDLEDVPWSELLAEHVLGELAVSGVGERAIECSRNLVLRLPEQTAKVRLQHGFAELEGIDEQCYLIDCDFWVDRTEVANANDSLQYLHHQAARCFRWCIEPKLHKAMEPGPVPTE